MNMRFVGAAASMLVTLNVCAGSDAEPYANPSSSAAPVRQVWEVGLTEESLSGGYANWHSAYVRAERRWADRTSVYGEFREAERYGKSDREFLLGGLIPVGQQSEMQIEAGAASPHAFLPTEYLFLGVHHQPVKGWSLGAGLRRAFYNEGPVRVFSLGVDRYIANERFSYTLFEGGPDRAALKASHRLQWAHYYGGGDWVAVSLTRGSETEHQANHGFLTSKVRGVGLSGQTGISNEWAFVWEVGAVRQGDLYTRRGMRIGLRHVF